MMMRMLTTLAILAAASSAQARTLKLDKDGLSVWVPDQWKVDTTDAGITALAPSQTATAVFLTQPIRDLELAYKNLPTITKAILPTVRFGQPKAVNVANLSAIMISGIADVTTAAAATKVEANFIVLITPGQRALYVITIVQAEGARTFDGAIQKILSGVAQTARATTPEQGAPAQKPALKENPCWEFKGHPNGWSRQDWDGVSYMVPRDWTATEGKNPDTEAVYLQIAKPNGSSILLFTFAAARPDLAWQALASQLQALGVGDAEWGEVVGQRALCAKGSASDGVLFHRGDTALAMLGRAVDDPAEMRGILGSIRWK